MGGVFLEKKILSTFAVRFRGEA